MNNKPILKWVGGKTQILEKVLETFPNEMKNYHEIFIGGGSVLLGLLSSDIVVKGKIFAYDSNDALISLYKNIQSHPDKLYDAIQEIVKEFSSCPFVKKESSSKKKKEKLVQPTTIEEAKKSQEHYYYWIRKEYNSLTKEEQREINGSAMFVFLNKTCFRGVYRVGPKGFNVPYGNYKNPEVINKEHLLHISKLIENVIFECCDFSESIKKVKKGDFVYMDPPYAPEKETSFVKYTDKGFAEEEHTKLFELCKNLKSKFVMSNSNVKMVRTAFADFNIQEVVCKRSINSKDPTAKTSEVLIKNF